jgi:hypothetical protein
MRLEEEGHSAQGITARFHLVGNNIIDKRPPTEVEGSANPRDRLCSQITWPMTGRRARLYRS